MIAYWSVFRRHVGKQTLILKERQGKEVDCKENRDRQAGENIISEDEKSDKPNTARGKDREKL